MFLSYQTPVALELVSICCLNAVSCSSSLDNKTSITRVLLVTVIQDRIPVPRLLVFEQRSSVAEESRASPEPALALHVCDPVRSIS